MEDAFKLANLILRQIDAQQEVRDRWFNYYLLITGATIALSTTVLKIFQGTVARQDLYIIAAVPLLLTGIIGICFFNLYLRQRRNYLNHYGVLAAVQKVIVEQTLYAEYDQLYPKRRPIERRPKGADYFTVWVQIVLISAYFGAALALIEASITGNNSAAPAVGVAVVIVAAIILERARKRFEKG